MRPLLLAALIATAPVAAGAPATAAAQPYAGVQPDAGASAVTVGVAPEFAERARLLRFEQGDLDVLQRDLSASATHALQKAARRGGPVRLELLIRDAVPNRPTAGQLARTISLSLRSRGVGGASVGGVAVFADGRRVPLDYGWYETNLQNDFSFDTWGDADRAFQIFSGRIADNDLRPFHLGSRDRNAGKFGQRYPGDTFTYP